jgi:putative oxidoreductase
MMDKTFGAERSRDGVILISRILLMLLFVIFGSDKVLGYTATAEHFAQTGVPMPDVAAFIALVAEFFVGLALLLGVLTRPLAVAMAVYTLGTALLGHHFWTMDGAARVANEINFFKNMGIIGGLLLLYVTGAGRYSIDAKIGLADEGGRGATTQDQRILSPGNRA